MEEFREFRPESMLVECPFSRRARSREGQHRLKGWSSPVVARYYCPATWRCLLLDSDGKPLYCPVPYRLRVLQLGYGAGVVGNSQGLCFPSGRRGRVTE